MRRLILDKKASMPGPITILVLLIFLLTSVAIGLFAGSTSKVKTEISNLKELSELQVKENLLEYYFSDITEEAVIESYEEVAQNGDYIQGATSNPIEFEKLKNTSELDILLKTKFDRKFRENLVEKSDVIYSSFGRKYFREIGEALNNQTKVFNAEEEEFVFDFIAPEINSSSEKISVESYPAYVLDFRLKDLGLEKFSELMEVKEKCLGETSLTKMESCYEKDLENFNVRVEEKKYPDGQKYFLINLESKKEFLINGELRDIEFSFVAEHDKAYVAPIPGSGNLGFFE